MKQGSADTFIGKTLGGKYVVEVLLNEGGMGLVYLATQIGTSRSVAVKVLRPEFVFDDNQTKRLQREARSIASLNHPNIVTIIDTGETDSGQHYVVLEFLDGLTLADLIDNTGPMPPARAITIFLQICDVMQYAHDKGIIDRDVSPMNIMILRGGGRSDVVKMIDFGMLKYDNTMHMISQKLTMTGDIMGNPMYLSPEQATADEVDLRTDIYSLGVVMWETLAGTPLFTGRTLGEMVTKHAHAAPPLLNDARPDLKFPAMLENIVMTCLRKNPADRYQSMKELSQALNEFLRKYDRQQFERNPTYLSTDNTRALTGPQKKLTKKAALASNQSELSEISSSWMTAKDLLIAVGAATCGAILICVILVFFLKH